MEFNNGDIVVFNDLYFTNTMRSKTPKQLRSMTVQSTNLHEKTASVIVEGTKTPQKVAIDYLKHKN